jgi:hypothetical protein
LRLRAITAGKQRRERRGPARLCDDSQHFPNGLLRCKNLIVCNQYDVAHIFFCDRKHEGSDATRGERIRRDAASFGVYRFSGFDRPIERGRGFRLDPDNLNAAGVPPGDSSNKPAAADSDKNRIEIWRLSFKLQADRPLTEQRFFLIVSMDRERP